MKWSDIFHIHDWVFANMEDVLLPKKGPFDPRLPSRRMVEKERYVCCKCGKVELRLPNTWY